MCFYLTLFSILILQMSKYQINYSRKFPDHRVPIDHTFDRHITRNVSTYFSFIKDGFNTSAVKFAPIWLSGFSILALTVAALWVFKDQDPCVIESQKRNMPGYRYILLTKEGGYGGYDNILQKFQKEEGGIRDLPFDE